MLPKNTQRTAAPLHHSHRSVHSERCPMRVAPLVSSSWNLQALGLQTTFVPVASNHGN
jgi:hypothetical protein